MIIPPSESAPKEVVQEALLSPIEAVRLGAAIWFSGRDIADVSVMKTVIESVQRYGIDNSLLLLEDLILPQDETTVAWMTSELDKKHDLGEVEVDNYCWFLAEMLCRTDPKLLNEEMVHLRCFPKCLEKDFLERIELTNLDWRSLWYLLKQRIRSGEDACPYNLNLLRESMARHVDRKTEVLDTLLGRNDVLKRLKKQGRFKNIDLNDIKLFLLDLVGDMQITEALPYVLYELRVPTEEGVREKPKERIRIRTDEYGDDDDDFVGILSRIVDDQTLDRLYTLWREKPRRYEWFPDMLQSVDTPKGYGIAIAMLKSEMLDIDDAEILASYLLNYCVENVYPLIPGLQTEASECSSFSDDDSELRVGFVVAKMIYPGKRSTPDQDACFEKWRRELEEDNWGLDDSREQMQAYSKREEFEGDFEDEKYC
ncbi:MAG: hypothetical protein FWC43_10125 [Planctomycetaceae bacterium]|nr:hypothetical protein [Planctomycetaceae bacterium]